MKNILFIGVLCLAQYRNVQVWCESGAEWKFNILISLLFGNVTSIEGEEINGFQIGIVIQTIIKN